MPLFICNQSGTEVRKTKRIEKATAISNAKIQFVSLVDRAANKREFLLKKEASGKAAFKSCGRIVKADTENHYVTGVVYEPMVEDTDGNYMEESEIVKAAYYFAKNGDKVDIQHSFEPCENVAIVENWVAKADFEIGEEKIKKGTWLMTAEISDPDLWEKVEKGEITGFSMGGVGTYSEEDVDLSNVVEKEDKKNLLVKMAEALGLNVVQKGVMAEIYEERNRGSAFWNAIYTLEDCLQPYDPITGRCRFECDEEKVREILSDFSTIISDLLTGEQSIAKALDAGMNIEKAGKKMSGKNKETLAGIYESLGAFLKEFDDSGEEEEVTKTENKEEKEVTKDEVQALISVAVQKAMSGEQNAEPVKKSENEPITWEAIEKMVAEAVEKAQRPVEKEAQVDAAQIEEMVSEAVQKAMAPLMQSHGVPNNLNDSGISKAKNEPHYLHGIL